MAELLHANITDKALRAYYSLYNAHGHDYPEAYYEEMMRLEFEALGVPYASQVGYQIVYKGAVVGRHITDMELDGYVVLEFKVHPQLLPRHYAQLISNLKVSGKEVGLLMNFGGVKPETGRRVLSEAHRMPHVVWNPGAPDSGLLYPDVTLALRRAAWEVYMGLGAGFVYRVYANAMHVEMSLQGIPHRRFRRLLVEHRNREIGSVPLQHYVVNDQVVFTPVASATIGLSDKNKTRMVMQRHGLRLGMIVNFVNEKLQVEYVR